MLSAPPPLLHQPLSFGRGSLSPLAEVGGAGVAAPTDMDARALGGKGTDCTTVHWYLSAEASSSAQLPSSPRNGSRSREGVKTRLETGEEQLSARPV